MKEKSAYMGALIMFPLFIVAAFFIGFFMNSAEGQSEVEIEANAESVILAENETSYYIAELDDSVEGVFAVLAMDEQRAELVMHMRPESNAEYEFQLGNALVSEGNTVVRRGSVQGESGFIADTEGDLILRTTHPVRILENKLNLYARNADGEEMFVLDFVPM